MQDVKTTVAQAVHLEIFIERWANGDMARYPWSIWIDGKQLVSSHGQVEYDSPENARNDALRICSELDRKPDRVTEL